MQPWNLELNRNVSFFSRENDKHIVLLNIYIWFHWRYTDRVWGYKKPTFKKPTFLFPAHINLTDDFIKLVAWVSLKTVSGLHGFHLAPKKRYTHLFKVGLSPSRKKSFYLLHWTPSIHLRDFLFSRYLDLCLDLLAIQINGLIRKKS